MKKSTYFFGLLRRLFDVRAFCSASLYPSGSEVYQDALFWLLDGRDYGHLSVAEFVLLDDLLHSAFLYSGDPFPCPQNAGPYMPDSVWMVRHLEALKSQEAQQVAVNEPERLSAPTPPARLFLLCLLGKSPSSSRVRLQWHPVGVSRLPAPWAAARGRWGLRFPHSLSKSSALSGVWPIQGAPGLVLRETHAKRPPAPVLERLRAQSHARPIRTAARFVHGVTA